jgi:hypothetical protein
MSNDDAPTASFKKLNPYANKENEDQTDGPNAPNFSESRRGRDRSKSRVYSEFQRLVPALMEYETLRASEFKPQIKNTNALLRDLLAEADRVEANAKELIAKVVKAQEITWDTRSANRAMERRIAEKQQLLSKQADEGKDLRKRLLDAKQRWESMTIAKMHGLPHSDHTRLISQVHAVAYDDAMAARATHDKEEEAKRPRGKRRTMTNEHGEDQSKPSPHKNKENKEGTLRANSFALACNGLMTRLAMLRDELKHEDTAKRTSPVKKQKFVPPRRTPGTSANVFFRIPPRSLELPI